VFITAGPISKLCAWEEEDSGGRDMCYEIRLGDDSERWATVTVRYGTRLGDLKESWFLLQ